MCRGHDPERPEPAPDWTLCVISRAVRGRARPGVSALPATLQGSVPIVRRCADHVTPGHFHLRHRRRGVFTFDARGAAGEKLLRAQRADDHVFVCAQFRRASNHDGPTLCCFVNGRRYRQTRYVGSRCAVCRQVDRHRQQVDTCWWGNRWKSSHWFPHSSHGEEPADGESSGQLQALYHDRRPLAE